MKYFDRDEVKNARQIDLLTYLRQYEPRELVHVAGNIYCTREHDSLKISNGNESAEYALHPAFPTALSSYGPISACISQRSASARAAIVPASAFRMSRWPCS